MKNRVLCRTCRALPVVVCATLVAGWPGAGLAPAQPPAAAPAEPADVSDVLRPIVERRNVPALAAVVIRGDRVIAQGVAGVRKIGDPTPATIGDRWHLGSCTKSMTATLCGILVDQGKLTWETRLVDVFPELKGSMKPAWHGVTLEQLLTQTAGAPANLQRDGLWARLWKREGTPTDQRLQLLREVVTWEPDHEPGAKFAYSNTNYAIAGAMAERATGVPWETLIQEKLFTPLGITSAGFGAPGRAGEIDEPRGTAGGASVEPGPNADNPAAIGPGGTVHMSLPDWGKYASLHLSEARAGAMLKPETFRRLHTLAKSGYAMGWGVTSRSWAGPRATVLTHNGSNTMWFAVAWLAPDKDMAVLVAMNSAADGAGATDDAAAALVTKYIAPAPLVDPSLTRPK